MTFRTASAAMTRSTPTTVWVVALSAPLCSPIGPSSASRPVAAARCRCSGSSHRSSRRSAIRFGTGAQFRVPRPSGLPVRRPAVPGPVGSPADPRGDDQSLPGADPPRRDRGHNGDLVPDHRVRPVVGRAPSVVAAARRRDRGPARLCDRPGALPRPRARRGLVRPVRRMGSHRGGALQGQFITARSTGLYVNPNELGLWAAIAIMAWLLLSPRLRGIGLAMAVLTLGAQPVAGDGRAPRRVRRCGRDRRGARSIVLVVGRAPDRCDDRPRRAAHRRGWRSSSRRRPR